MGNTTLPFCRVATFARPSNTTQYTAADAVSDNATTATASKFTLTGMAPAAGMGGVIHSVTLHKDDHDLTGADFDIYFFTTQPAGTTYEDNAAIAITDAVFATCIGFVALVGSTDGRSVETGDIYCKTNLDIPYTCASGSNSLYYVIVARGTYTPADGETFTLTVGGVAG